MPSVTADAFVRATPEQCFEVLSDPARHPEFVPGLIDIEATPLPEGGFEGEFDYRLLGVPLSLRFHDRLLVPPNRRVFDVRGRISGTATYELEAETVDGEPGTRFTFENEFAVPGPGLLRPALVPPLRWYIGRDADRWVADAKRVIEKRPSGR